MQRQTPRRVGFRAVSPISNDGIPQTRQLNANLMLQSAGELRAGYGASADAPIGEDLFASCGLQRIALQVQMLVSSGDSRISDHFELSDGFSGLTSGGFCCALFSSGKRSFSVPGGGQETRFLSASKRNAWQRAPCTPIVRSRRSKREFRARFPLRRLFQYEKITVRCSFILGGVGQLVEKQLASAFDELSS
jgi:hypothetical protein